MSSGLRWYGEAVVARMQRAARVGVNRCMGVAVLEAKATHPWKNRTGTAERSIRIVKGAVTAGTQTLGLWGSASTGYFRGLEFGTGPHTILPRRGRFLRFKVGDRWVFARSVRHPGTRARPTLAPAARRVYPLLSGLIRDAYSRGGA